MRKEQFEKEEFYHIYNRGVDKRKIFLDDTDRIRFIHSLYVFNNFLDIPMRFNIRTLEPQNFLTPIEPFVRILGGCLMSNHYHLILTPSRKGGISKFLQKVGLSQTNYFNKRYDRIGRLFESTFKAKHIDRQEYAAYLSQYIHLNPADLFRTKSGTKEEGFEKMVSYPWSTLADYVGGKSNFSIVLDTSFRDNILGLTPEEYKKFVFEMY